MEDVTPAKKSLTGPHAIVIKYAVFAALWIFFSDTINALFSDDHETMTRVSMVKGWLFVAVTSALLYGLIHRLITQISDAHAREIEALLEKRKASDLLAASEQRYRDLSENSSEWIWTIDLKGQHTYTNHRGAEILGYNREEFLAMDPIRLVHPDDQARFLETFRRASEQGEGWHGVLIRWQHQDGGYRTLESSASPMRDLRGQLQGFQGVDRDVTERLKTEADLARYREHLEELVEERTAALITARAHAEAANVAKSAFLANMSHEIRTPLNAIAGMAHLMRRAGLPPDQLQRLDKLETAGNHLLDIINAILDLSKIEAGKFSLDEMPVSIDDVVDNVVGMVAERARAKHLALSVDVPLLPEGLVGDRTRLQQALLNYTTNAIKFTAAGEVSLRVQALAETPDDILLRFEVSDTGIGIAPDSLPRLFASFEQADNTITRRYGGTGLGLAITRKIAELMGGETGVDSTVGQGSTFWMTVRLRKGIVEAAPSSRRLPTGQSAERLLREHHAGTRVLLVEDEPLNREIARLMLEDVGLVVDEAEDGAGAVACAQSTDYAAIFMDLQMPNIDGLEATRRIRQLPDRQHTPIIAMTANAFADDQARCHAAGMTAFLSKPVNAELLSATLLKLLPQRGPTTSG